MKLGIKVNADAESFIRLSTSNAPFAEVWFNINNKDSYTDLFGELQRRHMDVGLHFWGMLEDNIAPNIAYPDTGVIDSSMRLIRQTIDNAGANGFSYVNIHPGAAALAKVNYQKQQYECITKPADTDCAVGLFLENVQRLHTYAATKNVLLTVETVPMRITDGWYDASTRHKPKNIYELPIDAIIQAARLGITIANDFCHTAANVIADDPDVIYTYVKGITQLLAPQTRLIHLGFVVPPYNGTDNHDMLTNPIFRTNSAIPNYSQTVELLQLFSDRNDIRVLAEPKEDHVSNYVFAKKLLKQAVE